MADDITHIRISIGLHAAVAIAIGWISVLFSSFYGDMPSILVGLIVLWVLGRGTRMLVGRKEMRWWFGNGVIIYLFVWLISWILFFNLAV